MENKTMAKPFFSVIIPTYNRAHSIAKSIESVIRQNFMLWELIIIDDGSKDNTEAVVKQFNDERVKYHYQQNTERSQARNHGIKMALGQYICFLDSDDEYCHHHLNSFYNYIEKLNFPEAMIFSNPIVINNHKEILEKVANFDEKNTLAYILKNSIIPDRVCIHKSVFQEYKFNPKIHIGEDTILWAQITNRYSMYHLEEYTVKYHVHDDNSVNLKNNVYLDRLKGLNQLFKEPAIEKRLNSTLKHQIISVCHFGIARHYELKREFFKMSFHAIVSIFYDFKSPQNKAKLYMIYSFFRKK
jgi:glycosyltransferase involved in cell wall biosynthesis